MGKLLQCRFQLPRRNVLSHLNDVRRCLEIGWMGGRHRACPSGLGAHALDGMAAPPGGRCFGTGEGRLGHKWRGRGWHLPGGVPHALPRGARGGLFAALVSMLGRSERVGSRTPQQQHPVNGVGRFRPPALRAVDRPSRTEVSSVTRGLHPRPHRHRGSGRVLAVRDRRCADRPDRQGREDQQGAAVRLLPRQRGPVPVRRRTGDGRGGRGDPPGPHRPARIRRAGARLLHPRPLPAHELGPTGIRGHCRRRRHPGDHAPEGRAAA